jgi:hypothetical protein
MIDAKMRMHDAAHNVGGILFEQGPSEKSRPMNHSPGGEMAGYGANRGYQDVAIYFASKNSSRP